MNRALVLLLATLPLFVLTRCGVSRQLSEAKTFGDCRYRLLSADSVSLSGYDIRQFRNLNDLNPVRFPRLAAALLTRNVPLDLRVNLGITNPTNRVAGINQLEYRVLLKTKEIFQGYVNQRIEVPVGGSQVVVPIRLSANAYQLLTDAQTRDAFAELVQNLSGNQSAQPTRLTIKIKPTLSLGGKAVNYPGYITIDQEVTNKILLGQ